MSLHVQRQVVGAREGALAAGALERPVAGVLAVVTRQLVGARELPRAAGPRAPVWLLAGVRAHVRLEVRALAVRLGAAGERALVDRRTRSDGGPGRAASSPPPAPRRADVRLEHVRIADGNVERRPGRRDGGAGVAEVAGNRVRGREGERQRTAEALRRRRRARADVDGRHLLERRRRRREGVERRRRLRGGVEEARIAEEHRLAGVGDRRRGRRKLAAVRAGVGRQRLDVVGPGGLHQLVEERQRRLLGDRFRFVAVGGELHRVVRVETEIGNGRVVDDEVQIQQIVVAAWLGLRCRTGGTRQLAGTGGTRQR